MLLPRSAPAALSALLFSLLPATVHGLANAIIQNNCAEDLHMWEVPDGYVADPPYTHVPSGGQFKAVMQELATGGVSIKISNQAVLADPIVQFEYSITDGKLSYDISFVNCAQGESGANCVGWDRGMVMTNSLCGTFSCAPSTYCPQAAYFVDVPPVGTDPVKWCDGGQAADLILTMCSSSSTSTGGGSASSASSPATTASSGTGSGSDSGSGSGSGTTPTTLATVATSAAAATSTARSGRGGGRGGGHRHGSRSPLSSSEEKEEGDQLRARNTRRSRLRQPRVALDAVAVAKSLVKRSSIFKNRVKFRQTISAFKAERAVVARQTQSDASQNPHSKQGSSHLTRRGKRLEKRLVA